MKIKNLEEIGLSLGEIKVYTALLELGVSGLNKIQEKTGIERRNIYDILNKLIDKGLISYTIEKGKRTYQCANPNKILEIVQEKQESLKVLKEQIPSIKDFYEKNRPEIKVEIYRGNEAIKTLLNEILEYKESFWMGGNSFEKYMAVPESLEIYFDNWMRRRVKKKHIMHDLVSRGTFLRGLEPKNISKHKKLYYKYNTLPKDLYVPMVIIIYGQKVIQIQWGEQSFAILIESSKIKESYMKYFDHFWKDPW